MIAMLVRLVALLALLGTAALLDPTAIAEAQPMPPGFYGGPPRFAPYYGRFGPYGYRRFPRWRSYGTGYHGRGTATGGPVGGLPSRN